MKKGLLKLGVLLSAAAIALTTVTIVPQAEENYQQIVYVDANAKSSGAGTQSSPFRTVQAAKDYVRKINKNMKGDIFVDIAPGYYYIEETLNFDNNDGGTNGYDVIWGSSAEERPLLSGGKYVEGEWKVVDSEKNIYAIPYEGPEYVRQIYVNDVRAQRAWTEGEYELMNDSNSVKTKEGYTTEFTDILNWRNIGDIEFSFVKLWTQSCCAVHSVKAREDGKVDITMDGAMWGQISVNKQNGTVEMPWRIENAYELMDTPGEFYYDRALKELYYIPREGDNMATAEVIVPFTDTLMSIGGSAEGRTQNIVFKNLRFSHSAWYKPDYLRGWTDSQNNVHYGAPESRWLPGAITIEYGDYIDFYDCEISHIGQSGVNYMKASHDNEFIGNHVYDTAAGATHFGSIMTSADKNGIGVFKGDSSEDVYNLEVRNNWIHDFAHSHRDGVGVTVGYVSYSNFIHNEVGNGPYSGFHVNWGWTGDLVRGKKSRDIHIEHNYIYNTMHGTPVNDGAAVYTLGPTGGTLDNPNTVSYNYIRQTERTGGAGALYTDEGSSYYQLKNNVIDFYDAYHNEITNGFVWANTWTPTISFIQYLDCYTTDNPGEISDRGTNTGAKGTTYVSECNWNDDAKKIIREAGLEDEYRAKLGGAKTKGYEKLILHNGENGYVPNDLQDARAMKLDVGETRHFTYTAQNTYAEVVPSSAYSVEFKSLTPDIIDVTNNSVTAKKSGNGYMEFTVTYDGGKTQTRKVHVICGDNLAKVEFKDRTTKLLIDAELKLELVCTSALGNSVTDYDVTYSTSDAGIATVSNDGVVRAVGEGDVQITATVTAEGVTKSATRTISCSKLRKFDTSGLKVTQINDLFNDAEGWYKGNASVFINNSKKDTLYTETPGSFTMYKNKTFDNELLAFNVNITGPDTGWPCIVFGQKSEPTVNPVNGQADCYLITIKPEEIELQRFNKGIARTMLYGVYGTEGKFGRMPNTYVPYGKEVNMQLGAFTNPGGGTRLIMNVNGYNVFDVIDDFENNFQGPYYFGCINQNGSITFTRAAEVASGNGEEEEKDEFLDIKGHWASSSIKKLRDAGFVSGINKTTFAPNNTISRAEFLAIATRVLRLTASNHDTGFGDVPTWGWYASTFAAALEAGIIDSHFVVDNNIQPETPIRRDEMASILVASYYYLYGDYPEVADITTFNDGNAVEPWAVGYMKNAVGGGLMYGDDLNNLNPTGTATRAEAAAMLQRFVEMVG
ncbi:MAG: S-layer homology domain-containing protein [Eubacteriales bacterium]|nr:S-layer homology domain-containing protein [Eubacteriales bacterium]